MATSITSAQDVVSCITYTPPGTQVPAGLLAPGPVPTGDFTTAQIARIEDAITKLYDNSATARGVMDKIVTFAGGLEIAQVDGRAAALQGQALLFLDLDFIDRLGFVDQTGVFRQFPFERVLMHEIVHAVEGLEDNYFNPNPALETRAFTDYKGDTVNLTNTIMEEVRAATDPTAPREDRISYISAGAVSDIPVGTDFSLGRPVDTVIFGSASPFLEGPSAAIGLISTGVAGASNDVLRAAGDLATFLSSGDGDDVLYGSARRDTLEGGAGADVHYGGTDGDTVTGTAAELSQDLFADFDLGDSITFVGETFTRADIGIVQTGATVAGLAGTYGSILIVPPSGGPSFDIKITTAAAQALDALIAAGEADVLVNTAGGETTLLFERAYSQVADDGDQKAAPLINGVDAEAFFEGNGTRDFRVTLDTRGIAADDGVLGVYEIDGNLDIVNARVLFDSTISDQGQTVDIANVAAGNGLGFFLLADAADGFAARSGPKALTFVDAQGVQGNAFADGADLKLAIDGAITDTLVFHSADRSLNRDGLEHVVSGVAGGPRDTLVVAFEDLLGGGDADYQDVVLAVEAGDFI